MVDKKTMTIKAGHLGYETALYLEMKQVPVVWLEDMTPQQLDAYMIMENELSEMGEWNKQNVKVVLDRLKTFDFKPFKMNFKKFNGMTISSGFDKTREALNEPETPENAAKRVKRGDLFQLGNQRLLCGDSTREEDVHKLLGKIDEIDVIVTDPPYSSGGFQESGKATGSIGTQRTDEESGKKYTPKIQMDDLSTRGYQKLIRDCLHPIFAHNVYMFTDWKMWDWTRESVETGGYQVRSMIVWDKLQPGLGIQWRGQHELICFGKAKATVVPDWGMGNVIQCQRSGNKHHPTEKPVALLQKLIENNKRHETIYDPFGGSCSTMMTAEQLGKVSYCMEMDPTFCDISIARWEKLTGERAEKL